MKQSIPSNNARSFLKKFRPLLSHEEETALFSEWKETGNDQVYLTKITLHYGPIIWRCIKDLSSYQMPVDELLSEGLVALIEAAYNFDLSFNVRFSAYARICVKGKMQAYITKNYFLIHVCTNHNKKDLFYTLRKRIAISMMKTGQFKLTNEIAEEVASVTNTTIDDVRNMYGMFQRPQESLSDPLPNTNSSNEHATREDIIPNMQADGDSVQLVMDNDIIEFQRSVIDIAMENVLTQRERRIFSSQVLAEKGNGSITLEQLGNELSISKERVRQLRNKATGKIHEEINRLAKEMEIDPLDILT